MFDYAVEIVLPEQVHRESEALSIKSYHSIRVDTTRQAAADESVSSAVPTDACLSPSRPRFVCPPAPETASAVVSYSGITNRNCGI